ncbi:MAG: polysaccharide deacetylase family protein [Nitrospiraceae bacterium]|nr:MAG: polysaccharide deacetylase family protein [Nitrospiraceae bacterium]
MKSRRLIELKYKVAWYIGALFSFFLYFSGIAPFYILLRKKILKRHIVLVLTYHRINDTGKDKHISVSLETFKRQMAYLNKKFKVISLDDLIQGLQDDRSLKNDAVAITFDDGWKDNYTNAFRIIKNHDFPAAIFVATDFIGKDYGLTEDEIKTMHRNDIIFGAHTVSHISLSKVDYETAVSEVKDSKLKLEKILQHEVEYFAYPYGKRGQDFTHEAISIVRKAGLTAAFSTNNGCISRKSDLFALERIGIRDFPMFVFKVRVSGIFENRWLSALRKLLKI